MDATTPRIYGCAATAPPSGTTPAVRTNTRPARPSEPRHPHPPTQDQQANRPRLRTTTGVLAVFTAQQACRLDMAVGPPQCADAVMEGARLRDDRVAQQGLSALEITGSAQDLGALCAKDSGGRQLHRGVLRRRPRPGAVACQGEL